MYASEKSLNKISAANKKEGEEIVKLDARIKGVDAEISEVGVNSKKRANEEHKKLKSDVKSLERSLEQSKQRANQEKAELEALLHRERELAEEHEAQNIEYERLKDTISTLTEKEVCRQQTFKNVAEAINIGKKRNKFIS